MAGKLESETQATRVERLASGDEKRTADCGPAKRPIDPASEGPRPLAEHDSGSFMIMKTGPGNHAGKKWAL